jgi:hypothetical protein
MAVVELPGGASIVFEAVDATTGATVTGVKISGQAVTAVDLTDDNAPPEPIAPSPVTGAYLNAEPPV